MAADELAERLDGIRKRFSMRLSARLAEIESALPALVGDGADVASAVYSTHRKVHDLCGVGPTLGFDAIGRAARVCERILLNPSRHRRGLNEHEMAHLKEGLVALRAAAQTDIQSTGAVPE
jgi:hypothetical protein